ncbi:MAG: hypothetical protein IKW59_07055 [Clostridia bacterium]|nr:hypothetical protein [Clostridia bacterium]
MFKSILIIDQLLFLCSVIWLVSFSKIEKPADNDNTTVVTANHMAILSVLCFLIAKSWSKNYTFKNKNFPKK